MMLRLSSLLLTFSITLMLTAQAQQGDRTQGPPPTPNAEENPIIRPLGKRQDANFLGISIGYCPCSPSNRGHPPLHAPEVQKYVEALRVVSGTPMNNLLRASRERLVQYAGREMMQVWSAEAVINLDASMRDSGGLVLCAYDNTTGKNFMLDVTNRSIPPFEVTVKQCDEVPEYRAPDERAALFVNRTIDVTAIPIPAK